MGAGFVGSRPEPGREGAGSGFGRNAVLRSGRQTAGSAAALLSGPYRTACNRVIPRPPDRGSVPCCAVGRRTPRSGAPPRPERDARAQGRAGGLLYGIRRPAARERLGRRGGSRLRGLLEAGDPAGSQDGLHAKKQPAASAASPAASKTSLPAGNQPARPDHPPPARRTQIVNRRSRPTHQRRQRSHRQPHRKNQTRRLRVRSFADCRIRASSTPGNPTGTCSRGHSPLKSDEPLIPSRNT